MDAFQMLEACQAERARQKAELQDFARSANRRPARDLNRKADYWLSRCLDDEAVRRNAERDKHTQHAPFAIANAKGGGWDAVDLATSTIHKVDAVRNSHKVHYVETR